MLNYSRYTRIETTKYTGYYKFYCYESVHKLDAIASWNPSRGWYECTGSRIKEEISVPDLFVLLAVGSLYVE